MYIRLPGLAFLTSIDIWVDSRMGEFDYAKNSTRYVLKKKKLFCMYVNVLVLFGSSELKVRKKMKFC